MRIQDLLEDGRIVKGVNTTADVGTNQISIEAGKFGNKVDKDGKPPLLGKKTKGKSTNVLFNLGLAENKYKSWFRDKFSPDPEYKAWRRLYRLNPKKAKYHFRTKHKEFLALYTQAGNEQKFTPYELALMEGGHEVPERPQRKMSGIMQELIIHDFKEALGELNPKTEIYVDMDGVLADFFGEWAKVMGKKSFRDIENPADAIQKIKYVDDFWLKLPMLPQARDLLGLIKKVKGSYNICSSPLADDPRSEPHKKEWIRKNLDFFPPNNIYITHDKAKYAVHSDGTPNILIDDYGVNIDKWEQAGGIGFKYKDHKFERTAKALKNKMSA